MENQMQEMRWTKDETIWINKHFWDIISCLDERLKVLNYLVNHRAGQYAIGTIREISENTGLSASRVQKFIKTLEKKDIIQRKGNGIYILPQALIPIDEQTKNSQSLARLMLDYIADDTNP